MPLIIREDIERVAPKKPEGYREAVYAARNPSKDSDTHIFIARDKYLDLRRRFSPPEDIELASIAEELKGKMLLGDRVEEWAKKWGADRAAAAWERWTGTPCGCDWRKKILNDLHRRWRGILGMFRMGPESSQPSPKMENI